MENVAPKESAKKSEELEGLMPNSKNKTDFIRFAISVILILLIQQLWIPKLEKKLEESKNTEIAVEQAQTQSEQAQIKSGKGIATKDKPLEVYLDPAISWTRIQGGLSAVYVYEADSSIEFICDGKPHQNQMEWSQMPPGKYKIYPYNTERIIFSWGTGNPPD
ncbi:hypothetical protein K8Q94_00210 [Candidatus Nomurabacteria bacterium]|nr:hypothetical protein [Candidatus Nomurabacteria bacterium]